jgi:hypothetical protein
MHILEQRNPVRHRTVPNKFLMFANSPFPDQQDDGDEGKICVQGVTLSCRLTVEKGAKGLNDASSFRCVSGTNRPFLMLYGAEVVSVDLLPYDTPPSPHRSVAWDFPRLPRYSCKEFSTP